jgi:hypothetical protein
VCDSYAALRRELGGGRGRGGTFFRFCPDAASRSRTAGNSEIPERIAGVVAVACDLAHHPDATVVTDQRRGLRLTRQRWRWRWRNVRRRRNAAGAGEQRQQFVAVDQPQREIERTRAHRRLLTRVKPVFVCGRSGKQRPCRGKPVSVHCLPIGTLRSFRTFSPSQADVLSPTPLAPRRGSRGTLARMCRGWDRAAPPGLPSG